MNLFRRPTSTLATAPLATVVLALALAAGPLFGRIAPWVVALFFVACAARLRMNRRGARLLSLPLKVMLFGLGAAGILLTYGTFLGIDPGLSFLVILVSLKLLETNTVRDFQVVALLGFFLALCDLFFTQSLTVWLYVAAIFLLLTTALVHFHRGSGARSFRGSARTAGVLLAQAVPIILLLFVFFPRTRHQFLMQFSQQLTGGGAMSDSLSPGSIASLALGKELVFRADFPDGNAPSISIMYWRAGVLWRGDGLTWVHGPQFDDRPAQLGGAAIRQRIIVQPHGARWLFALDRPTSGQVRHAHLAPGDVLESDRAVLKRVQYEVISRPENREATLPPDQRFETTRKPTRISPQVQRLVHGWRSAHRADRDLVDAALYYFRAERFTYTLEPGTYGTDALHEFLFDRRAGFCEHYAAAFASLMRIAGIPSRVVIGYHGGEYNALGKYVIVRQSEAHAWCEVWIKDEGWRRIDPTEMIAPERLTSGLASYLETNAIPNPAIAPPSATTTGWREVRREARLAWDSLNYQWDLRVLAFDEDNQRVFLANLGIRNFRWVEILTSVGVAIALLLGGIGLWQRRPGRPALDPAGRAYARFCRALAASGCPRESWEGPHHFGERAARHFAAQASAIREITALYSGLRYSPTPPPAAQFIRAVRALPRLQTP